MKTHFKEGGINEELIDNMVQLLENIVVLVRRVAPQYSGLFGTTHRWWNQKGPTP